MIRYPSTSSAKASLRCQTAERHPLLTEDTPPDRAGPGGFPCDNAWDDGGAGARVGHRRAGVPPPRVTPGPSARVHEPRPARTALIVVDLVPFFVAENPYARGIVPQVNRLAHAVRSAGGVVAWVAPADAAATPARVEFFGEKVAESYRTCGGGGPVPDRLWSGLAWRDADLLRGEVGRQRILPGPLVAAGAARGARRQHRAGHRCRHERVRGVDDTRRRDPGAPRDRRAPMRPRRERTRSTTPACTRSTAVSATSEPPTRSSGCRHVRQPPPETESAPDPVGSGALHFAGGGGGI